MAPSIFRFALLCVPFVLSGCKTLQQDDMANSAPKVYYLEFVTPEVDATCATYEAAHGVTFGAPVPEFGNARTADQPGGGWIGVRGPMRADESPITRAYVLVDDIKAATAAAAENGAVIAVAPTEIPGRGLFAIFIQGGVEHALWQHGSTSGR